MGLLTHLSVLSQVALLAAVASSHVVTDPYVATHWNACPSTCESANPYDWDFYSNLRILKSCDKPMLLNLVVSNPTGDPNLPEPLYACSTSALDKIGTSKSETNHISSATRYSTKNVQMETAWRGEELTSHDLSHAELAAQLVQSHLDAPASQNATIGMGYSNGVALGAFIGSKMENRSKDRSVLQSFLAKLRRGELDRSGAMMQVCNSDRPAAYTLGVVAEASADPAKALGAVKETLATWNNGKCASGYSGSSNSKISVGEAEDDFTPPSHGGGTHDHGSSHGKRLNSLHSAMHRRGNCRALKVNHGEGCPELATRCGISPADFTKYNPGKSLCSSLMAGQHVCCSAGTLPDYSPKPNADGTCATYTVQSNDDCDKIAAAKSVTKEDIKKWNAKSWGWTGCSPLQAGGKHQQKLYYMLVRPKLMIFEQLKSALAKENHQCPLF